MILENPRKVGFKEILNQEYKTKQNKRLKLGSMKKKINAVLLEIFDGSPVGNCVAEVL